MLLIGDREFSPDHRHTFRSALRIPGDELALVGFENATIDKCPAELAASIEMEHWVGIEIEAQCIAATKAGKEFHRLFHRSQFGVRGEEPGLLLR